MMARGCLLLCGCVALLAGGVPAAAQIPDEFTNLKVLPKDIGKRQLIETMRNFSGALGVRCTHCHPGKVPGSLEGVDFASDELQAKKVARVMMNMVGEINGKMLPATGLKSLTRVRCVTCHRGLVAPETLDRVLLEVIEEKGVDAAVNEYRELRERYYGSGSYEFGPQTLNSVAEALSRQDEDLDGAITMMQLNVEVNPDAAFSHLLLGQMYARKGNKAAAIASIERSLELQPSNERAVQLLEQVRSSK